MVLMLKFLKLPFAKKMIYVEAVFWLASIQVAIHLLPFRWIARILGKHMATVETEYALETMGQIRLVSRAVNTMSRHMPWDCKCLVQAITGKLILRRRGIRTTLFLGMAKDNTGNLIAHAWLSAGKRIILGGGGLQKFAVVSTFA